MPLTLQEPSTLKKIYKSVTSSRAISELLLTLCSFQDAQVATSDCLKAFEDVLQKLDDKRKGEITRSMGMKMEQLKGELNQIIDSLRNDEELPTRSTKDS